MSYSFEEEFTRLQDFVKAYDITQNNCPVGISFSATGAIILKYSLSSSPKFFSNLSAVAEHIHQFLEDK